jgi:endoglucanase
MIMYSKFTHLTFSLMNVTKQLFACMVWAIALCFSAGLGSVYAQTPVAKNGQLKVIGLKLCNQYGNPIQLRGMSTHGIQWYGWGSCLTEASLDALANDWGADVLRISLYVQEGGYDSDPAGFTAQVSRLIEEATERGMYALVDWHQLTPGNPNDNLSKARTFFTDIANAHKNKNNVIYDVCNEPNGVSWAQIKTYADQIIPVIRAIDSDAVVLVGTHAWGSMGISDGRSAQDIVSNPLNFGNIMYTFHFYAADHQDQYLNELSWAADRLPVFVTEFGSQEASGDGPNDFTMTQRYIDLMRQKKISWTNWNYSDDFRSGAVWKTGTCSNGPWTVSSLKPSGVWMRERMLSPADDFPGADNTLPATPGNLSASAASSSQINLTWSDLASNETLFRIERSPDGSSGWTSVATTVANTTRYSNTGLSASTVYYYRVRAENANGNSAYSNVVNATTQGTPANNLALNKPATASSLESADFPASLTVDGNAATRWASAEGVDPQWVYVDLQANYSINRVVLQWEAAYAQAYQVQVSADAGSWTTIYNTTTGNGAIDDLTVSGTGRYVRVHGTQRGTTYGYSLFELEVYGTAAIGTPPAAPTSLSATAVSSSQINLTWTDNAGNESLFRIERSPNGSSGWASVATTGANTTRYSNTGLSGSTAYYYRVRAENATGNSAYSGVVSATTHTTATVNLALNKPATASSLESSAFPASLGVDGDATTRWASAEGVDPQWIYVDLQSSYSINRVVLNWEAAYARTYQVQVSADASNWTTVYTTTTGDGAVDDLTVSGNVRYVRVYGTQRGTTYGYSLFELEVYGTPLVTAAAANEFDVQVFSNPVVNQPAKIRYTLPVANAVKVVVYNSTGQGGTVTLLNEHQPAGSYTIQWDATSKPEGIYIAKFIVGDETKTFKIIVKKQ